MKLTVPTKAGERDVEGELLGSASTHREHHEHPPDQPPEPGGPRCSACRWTEVYILDDVDEYAVVVLGRSTVEGEDPRGRIERTDSPTVVVETLRMPRRGDGRLVHTWAARKALAEAADVDDDLSAAFHRGRD